MLKGCLSMLVLLLFGASAQNACGAVITAMSASFRDVSSAVGLAHDGDSVLVPAGSASWTETLLIGKGITLQGAGEDKTTILDDVPRPQRGQPQPEKRQQQTTSRSASLHVAQQFLRQSAPQRGPQRDSLIIVTLAPKQSFRMTGFTFRYGTIATKNSKAAVELTGSCPSVRLDHCHFDLLFGSHLEFGGCLYGVVDHCTFDARPGSSEILNVMHSTWGSGNNAFGDGSWAEPPYFGSDKFIFIEDCVFNNVGGLHSTNGSIDSWAGGRFVARYNIFNNTRPGNHGTETSGRMRSCRAMEIYNNKINFTLATNLGQIRGGTAVIHDNILTGPLTKTWGLVVYREIWPYPIWGGASGTNDWDLNDTEGDGTNVPGHRPHLYASGRHTGGNDSITLVVNGANWTPDQWRGYSLTNTSQTTPRNGFRCSSYIVSNTADSITFFTADDASPNQRMRFNTGDGFAIYKVLSALDQPGRGKGDLLSGNPPTHASWPHQTLEPIYAWNNTLNGVPDSAVINSPCPTIKDGRDYYSNRALPGYKPYTYPHPLTFSGPQAKAAERQ
jgi:hypothetical protein